MFNVRLLNLQRQINDLETDVASLMVGGGGTISADIDMNNNSLTDTKSVVFNDTSTVNNNTLQSTGDVLKFNGNALLHNPLTGDLDMDGNNITDVDTIDFSGTTNALYVSDNRLYYRISEGNSPVVIFDGVEGASLYGLELNNHDLTGAGSVDCTGLNVGAIRMTNATENITCNVSEQLLYGTDVLLTSANIGTYQSNEFQSVKLVDQSNAEIKLVLQANEGAVELSQFGQEGILGHVLIRDNNDDITVNGVNINLGQGAEETLYKIHIDPDDQIFKLNNDKIFTAGNSAFVSAPASADVNVNGHNITNIGNLQISSKVIDVESGNLTYDSSIVMTASNVLSYVQDHSDLSNYQRIYKQTGTYALNTNPSSKTFDMSFSDAIVSGGEPAVGYIVVYTGVIIGYAVAVGGGGSLSHAGNSVFKYNLTINADTNGQNIVIVNKSDEAEVQYTHVGGGMTVDDIAFSVVSGNDYSVRLTFDIGGDDMNYYFLNRYSIDVIEV